ncbi:hypothetical protein OU994_24370 [Pseudoduganella sp. SL102]|uniref:hypothetical protein n=1 Tax=Pseudoduganella sp. SL102 TaxID=2995154 RepID=UPI00248C4728|nr:hypothetical protein [Pseudoduganella sp. SL102]WBS01384.1 hypothetical protein OU994_24370 [Pseudoduganella sp. SL102]
MKIVWQYKSIGSKKRSAIQIDRQHESIGTTNRRHYRSTGTANRPALQIDRHCKSTGTANRPALQIDRQHKSSGSAHRCAVVAFRGQSGARRGQGRGRRTRRCPG